MVRQIFMFLLYNTSYIVDMFYLNILILSDWYEIWIVDFALHITFIKSICKQILMFDYILNIYL